MKYLKEQNSVTIYTQPYKDELLYTMIWAGGLAKANRHLDTEYKIPAAHPVHWWVPYQVRDIEVKRWHTDMWKVYKEGEFLTSIYEAHIWELEPTEPGYYEALAYNPKMAKKFFDSKIHLEDYQRFPTFSPLQMNKGAPLPYTSVDSLIYSEKQEGEK